MAQFRMFKFMFKVQTSAVQTLGSMSGSMGTTLAYSDTDDSFLVYFK